MKKQRISLIGAVIAMTILLSGCFQMNATFTFDEGKVTPLMTTKLSQSLIELDENLGTNGKQIKDLTPEERLKVCTAFNEGNELNAGGVTVNEKGVDEANRLVCESVSDAISVNELKSENAFTATYDEDSKEYLVKGDFSQAMGSQDELASMDSSQLKQLGVEMTMSFVFNNLVSVTFDGKEITDTKTVSGVTVNENTVNVDLLDVESAPLEIKASDSSGPGALLWLSVAAFGLVLMGIAVYLVLRKNKTDDDKSSENFQSTIPTTPVNTPQANVPTQESSLPDIKDKPLPMFENEDPSSAYFSRP